MANDVKHFASDDHSWAAGLVFGSISAGIAIRDAYVVERPEDRPHLEYQYDEAGNVLPYVDLIGRRSGKRFRVTVTEVVG